MTIAQTLRARCEHLMEGYQTDIDCDVRWVHANPGKPFIHITRKTGTHIYSLPEYFLLIKDSPVPYLFGQCRYSEIYRQTREILTSEMMVNACLWLVYDGKRLKKITPSDGAALFARKLALALSKAQRKRRCQGAGT